MLAAGLVALGVLLRQGDAPSPAQAGTSVAAATTRAVDTVDTADTATDDADVDTVEAEPAATEVETSAFTLTPPAGWIRDAQEVDHDGYVESRWHLPGAPEVYVLIDHTVDFDGTPEDGARSVRKMTSRNADYASSPRSPRPWLGSQPGGGSSRSATLTRSTGS